MTKLKFWACATLFLAIGAIALWNMPSRHERAASREVVIDMPNPATCAPWEMSANPEGGWQCATLGNDDH